MAIPALGAPLELCSVSGKLVNLLADLAGRAPSSRVRAPPSARASPSSSPARRRCKKCSRVQACSSASSRPRRAPPRCAIAGCECGRSMWTAAQARRKRCAVPTSWCSSHSARAAGITSTVETSRRSCAAAPARARGVDRDGAHPPAARRRRVPCPAWHGESERFGWALFGDGKELREELAGWLVRTKAEDVDEGGGHTFRLLIRCGWRQMRRGGDKRGEPSCNDR
ncbi:hypothetical protein BC826DRAFT_512262 [Russula brevipes]|nr:hypothetical protein BC826DRAFT_512262 [Russula brevipes]